jgi:hypothetical protein
MLKTKPRQTSGNTHRKGPASQTWRAQHVTRNAAKRERKVSYLELQRRDGSWVTIGVDPTDPESVGRFVDLARDEDVRGS